MLIGHIHPSPEALTEELMPCLWDSANADEVRDIIIEIIALGCDISRPVKIHGQMEDALRNLEGPISDYEIVKRNKK